MEYKSINYLSTRFYQPPKPTIEEVVRQDTNTFTDSHQNRSLSQFIYAIKNIKRERERKAQ